MHTPNDNISLQFLRKKIQNIRSALFFNHSNIIPASIITVLRLDDEGHIWFFTKRPSPNFVAGEREFAARLDFFRKKTNYVLQITGKAYIINEKDIALEEWADMPPCSKQSVLSELMLIKVKMLGVEYFDRTPTQAGYWFGKIIKKIKQWLFENKLGYRPFYMGNKHVGSHAFGR